MKTKTYILLIVLAVVLVFSCKKNQTKEQPMQSHKNISAKEILGNPEYLAISYGGYRDNSREVQPTLAQLKEDLKIMAAMGIKIVRTYNVHFPHAENILKAISELKKEDSNFEMYVMLGAWIDCENAWTDSPNHDAEDLEANTSEIEKAVDLACQYSAIVKIITVGNEAMVHWATSYFVQPKVILKWVNHLQKLKQNGKLSKDLWITSSDNFASWGGGDESYHKVDLEKLIKAVDYISMHTYPFHDTHYNPIFWGIEEGDTNKTNTEKVEASMNRAQEYAKEQYTGVKNYMNSLGVKKPIHIGETGWASYTNELYGDEGSKATDEFKQGLFYKNMRTWTNQNDMSCFYFEAFDEIWKDPINNEGSENHFGLFTVDGKAKYALWNLVDKGVFKGLTRNGKPITKTYNGNLEELMKDVLVPNTKVETVTN